MNKHERNVYQTKFTIKLNLKQFGDEIEKKKTMSQGDLVT